MKRSDWQLRLLKANETHGRLGLVLSGEASAETITGTLRGPTCPYAATVATSVSWQPDPRATDRLWTADVFECCLWEPAHPFLYECDMEAAGTEPSVERFEVGFRALAIREVGLRVNGAPFRFRGLVGSADDPQTLQHLHSLGCNLLEDPAGGPSPLADRYGPFVTAQLPADVSAACALVASAGPIRPSIAIWTADRSWSDAELGQVREQDRTSLFSSRLIGDQFPYGRAADLVVVRGTEAELRAQGATVKIHWLARVRTAGRQDALDADRWQHLSARLDRLLAPFPRCIGWVAELDDAE